MLPIEARELPADLARIDELLSDPELLRPIADHWQREGEARGLLRGGSRPPDDRDGDLRAVDGGQAAGLAGATRPWPRRSRIRSTCAASV